MPYEDTIAAVSTPPGQGGIGIVRLSGPAAVAIARSVLPRLPVDLRSHTLHYGHVADPATGERLDEVLTGVMLSPRTYTRQDVVEINCHGGVVATSRVLALLIRQGARLAEPGEFTQRAFASGRIDLSQAEAVMDIVAARTEAAGRVALRQLGGGLSERINSLKDRLAEVLAHMEAQLDFPDEDLLPDSIARTRDELENLREDVAALAGTFDDGRLLSEGIRAVIAGRPNVGKSSLLNALLMRDRAIVTEMPGTTRDVLEEYVNVGGLPLKVVDTAGIRQAHDMAEAEGVRRSLRAIEEADVVLAVLDASEPLHPGDRELIERVKGRNAIIVLNKSDLPRRLEAEFSPPAGVPCVRLSAGTGEGIEELKEAVLNATVADPATFGQGIIVTNLRHKAALEGAASALAAALLALGAEAPLEILALEAREALDCLGLITGHVTPDEILNRIFSEFCIGK